MNNNHDYNYALTADPLKPLREAREEIELLRSTVTDCRIEIERIRAQRDHARREVCRSRASCIKGKQPEEIANALEWDCFKLDTVEQLRARLVKELYSGEG